MKLNIINYIKQIEEKLFKGYKLQIFKGYNASDKKGAQKVINDLYSNLSEEIENAKKELDH